VAAAPGRLTVVSRLRAPEAPESLTDDDSGARILSRADNCGFSASSATTEALYLQILNYSKHWPSLGWGHSLRSQAFQAISMTRTPDCARSWRRHFAHVGPEAVGSIAIFAAAAPRARSSKPSDTLGWNVAGP